MIGPFCAVCISRLLFSKGHTFYSVYTLYSVHCNEKHLLLDLMISMNRREKGEGDEKRGISRKGIISVSFYFVSHKLAFNGSEENAIMPFT